MNAIFLKEALFLGMTTNAFKLGTVLMQGWFWPRVSGCSVLYRGESMATIDFDNILTVANIDTNQIFPPAFVQHNNSSTYFYVVRRVNNYGLLESTLSAAVKTSIGSDGDLASPQPNSIFKMRAEKLNGNKIQLRWYYCPIKQESKPTCFNIYHDGGTGQVDYNNPIATINYAGRRFYSYQTNSVSSGAHLFVVRVEDYAEIEDGSFSITSIQLNAATPNATDLIDVKVI